MRAGFASYTETEGAAGAIAVALRMLGLDVFSGIANFVLGLLPIDGPDAATVVERCQRRGLFIRDAAQMGTRLGSRVVRVAVKDGPTNARMVEILAEALGRPRGPARSD